MKKRDILKLIKYHCEDDEIQFREVAQNIAKEFDDSGDERLAEVILSYISEINTFSIQSLENEPVFYTLLSSSPVSPYLPPPIKMDMDGILNAIDRNTDVSKFLLYGPPGTGKTEYVRYLANCLNREIVFVEFDAIIQSRLGETTKNIKGLFDEIRAIRNPANYIFMFDEIDALAFDRINSNDLREMGRATSAFLKEMDRTNYEFLIFATTNLYEYFDNALLRRFDACIDFGRYTQDDLRNISEYFLDQFVTQYSFIGRDKKLFRKIVNLTNELPLPGELKNIIKKCIVFSNGTDNFDYLKRFYTELCNESIDVETLRNQGFTLREIERLTNISKSKLSRLGREKS